MNLSAIIDRIRTQAQSFVRVAGAADFDGVENVSREITAPAAFVVPISFTPDPQAQAVGRQTILDEAFAVFIVVTATQDDRGQAAAESLESLWAELRSALIDYAPTGHTAIEYAGGQLERLDRGLLIWREDFELGESL